ncbi:MAG: cellulose biosynthesis protein CelD [Novosphingobium sp. 28-62-57]|uniref:GNAT family N-acetyltransferase n=1 Tax=unclassified Novosphingobium TaxID=2644732 RepID=UPI000BD84340|nr:MULTISPECIES: GNAT family N-acetyltransferase [unclassified Novosphingobium]OYW50777.1 MAG: cellulose biosynthesis protein CelD [Novosphingobium sp. 12-62-10]OYZ10085.1 MAG: cellulose biosynthesis protein CelD [Novosphingobium sp. 28-62-57]OZA35933.1 MAG: cellulose biosynthesis protein CelD [Novosphingobium sp. 17-62-9]HQS71216.1 GNAT family N-acetyltransferase [Novosphingobium sp.]
MNAPTLSTQFGLVPKKPTGTVRAGLDPWPLWATVDRRRAWAELADAATTPNPFFEDWYLLPSYQAFDPHGTGSIFSLYIGAELVGLLPLTQPHRYGRWPLPHFATWLHPNAFLGAPLVRAGCEALFWEALLEWADTNGSARALFLHLPAMPLENPLTQALFDVARHEHRKAALVMRQQRALLHSPLLPDLYLERALTGKKRKELRRQHARLAEQGELAFARHDDSAGLGEWTEAFLDLESRGWKGAGGSALASDPATAALFRQALAGAAAAGKLERLALTLDGRPIAMLANFLTPPGSFSFKTAFDENYARFSPGVLLQRENLALLSRPEITWCDSCATPDHPMIDSLWTERRPIGRISVAIGGKLRRATFASLLALELRRNPTGLAR